MNINGTELSEQHYKQLLARCGHKEDALSIAIERLLKKGTTFKDEDELLAYLAKSMHHNFLSLIRNEVKRKSVMHELPEGVYKPTNLEFMDLISVLSRRYREVLVLRFLEGYTIREISERLDIGQGTVYRYMHQALAELKKVLDI